MRISYGHGAGIEFDSDSFIYSRSKPFHRHRLSALLDELAERSAVAADGPWSSVMRSKGLVWVQHSNQFSHEWSHAGSSLEVLEGEPWDAVQTSRLGGGGTSQLDGRRQELIIIGRQSMAAEAVEATLDACLCTDAEISQPAAEPVDGDSGTAAPADALGCYFTTKRHSKAWVAARLAETDPTALKDHANNLHRIGRFKDALLLYDRAVELQPDNPDHIQARMAVYMRSNQMTRAVQDARRIVELRPDFVPAYLRAAGITLRVGDLSGTRELLDEARRVACGRGSVSIDMAFDKLEQAESNLKEARGKLDSGEYAEALEVVSRAMRGADQSEDLRTIRNEATVALAAAAAATAVATP
ncbi:hypothetical protein CYMTET_35828 [Cymbomonas tetramitiformis]|uniref:CobW C-terminal domain-containing protein n=1 Tax=Cymbomonas tetramitiformis TaxID=36881 RepID=A0AAE0KNR5_9CHLO|nr:hypothetical protein CYMTET_35828 [Cymbomonas tetramitiformis]